MNKDYKENVRLLKVNLSIAIILIVVLVGVLFIYGNANYQYVGDVQTNTENEVTNAEDPEIEFLGDFSQQESRELSNYVYSLKPKYRHFADKVTFVDNINEYSNQVKTCDLSKDSDKVCQGTNHRKLTISGFENHIYIFNPEGLHIKNTLCHEMLHSVVYRKEAFHPIVEELGEQEVCYKDGWSE